MIAEFRLEDVKSAGAIFDERKLQAVNSEYLRAMPVTEMVERAAEWQRSRWEPIAALVQERARTLAEVYAMTDFLYLPEPAIDEAAWAKETRRQPAFGDIIAAAATRYATIEWSAEEIHQATVAAGQDVGVEQLSKAQAPVRLAVTGRSVGPPLWESLQQLGRDRTIARLEAARGRLHAGDG